MFSRAPLWLWTGLNISIIVGGLEGEHSDGNSNKKRGDGD